MLNLGNEVRGTICVDKSLKILPPKSSQIKKPHVLILLILLHTQQVAEGDAANKENVTTSFKLMAESFREQLADLKREIIAELQMTKQREPPVEVQHQLLKQPSHIHLDVTETTGIHSLVSVASNLVLQIIRRILVVQ